MNYPKLDDLLKKDEDDTIEFKSSFKYDFKTKKPNKILQEEVVEAITGFLNANGGTVIIGVDNDNDNYIYGLDYDLKLYKDKSLDRFQQDLINKIAQFIGSEYYEFLKVDFPKKNDKIICVINIKRSTREVWFKDEYLCVRVGNTTRKHVGKKALDYIKMHWTEAKEKQVEKKLALDDLISKYVINRRLHGFRTVFVVPSLPANNIIPLNPDSGKFLRQNEPQYLRFGDYKVIQNGYQFHSKKSDSLAEITDEGFIYYREPCPISKSDDKICIERTMVCIIQLSKYAIEIYDKFGYDKDICIGLELTGVKNKSLFSSESLRFLNENIAENDLISIKKVFPYNDFKNISNVVIFLIQASSRCFGLEIKEEILDSWIKKYL